MSANFHTHTTFDDGVNTPEEMILAALDKGFTAIGFSGHGTTEFDLRYCIKDVDGYIRCIRDLKEKYKNEIQVYLGMEEDMFCPVDRERFDYIIGSSHYMHIGGLYYPLDSSYGHLSECLDALGGDVMRLAEQYYRTLCSYIDKRNPDIIGHFDLITKYDEAFAPFFLDKPEYHKLAEKYLTIAAGSGCIFEVNTGAMARGVRVSPYPAENLLHNLKKLNAELILSSDAHSAAALDFAFEDVKKMLRSYGFTHTVEFKDGEFVKKYL